ncbi:MAG TPA: pyridoxal-dependent decarboxylase [Candidatus Nanoarchaeia archaeon]|nr:pyridoxal-dependent decarboxylase [Candidatus Nanoarchaeia archaeon]
MARLNGSAGKSEFKGLVEKYSSVPKVGEPAEEVLESIVNDLFSRVPRWRSPELQYNVGTAVNSVALAAYVLALEENIYAINDGLAGNSLVAEEAVSSILARDLAGVEKKARGFFTFGGTATNLYAKKLGIKKAVPGSSRKGNTEGIKAMVTRDCHFSHDVSIDWLGIGKDNTIIIEPGSDRRSNLDDAERKIREALDSGGILTSIAVNGGTTYNHIVDGINGFVELRDRIVQEYSLSYTPHVHVDSVIGWSWLFFRGYDFENNPLDINQRALNMIREQYGRISHINMADSWGVDFHKGIGACPVDCSVFMVNDERDLRYISKKGEIDIHHLAEEFSFTSPVDFTLETSRSAGPALSALASLRLLGLNGYRRNLANLIEQTVVMRDSLREHKDMYICHEEASLGFVTMLRFYPPELMRDPRLCIELSDPSLDTKNISEQVNKYMKEFFTWDESTRMRAGRGVEYSISSGYITLSNGAKITGVKLYPVSPHFNEQYARKAVETIVSQKKIFDQQVKGK